MENDNNSALRITSLHSFHEVEHMLRNVRLMGDTHIKPYEDAIIEPKHAAITTLQPIALYVLAEQLTVQKKLSPLFQDFSLNIFDLRSSIRYDFAGQSFTMTPPIVETYYDVEQKKEVSIVLDGLHRIWLARLLGLKSIGVIQIRHIKKECSLVALPVSWREVKEYAQVPTVKRKYRYPTLEAFPDISSFSDVPVHQGNYLYFFYRDLGILGSSGIRNVH